MSMGPPRTLTSLAACMYIVPHCLAARAVITRRSRTSPTECLAKASEMMSTSILAELSASRSFWEAE
eukprot:181712-Heterocapsa_arctica.AAC.1